jgi:hypothetical protein
MTHQDRQVENESTLVNKRIVLLAGSSGIGLAVAQQVVAQGRMRLLHQAIKRAFNRLLMTRSGLAVFKILRQLLGIFARPPFLRRAEGRGNLPRSAMACATAVWFSKGTQLIQAREMRAAARKCFWTQVTG